MSENIFELLKDTIKERKELDQLIENAISEEEIEKTHIQRGELDVKIDNLLKECLLSDIC